MNCDGGNEVSCSKITLCCGARHGVFVWSFGWHRRSWGQSNQCGGSGDAGDSELRGRQQGELLENWLLTEKKSILGGKRMYRQI